MSTSGITIDFSTLISWVSELKPCRILLEFTAFFTVLNTYCNVQGAFAVKLSLKSKRESGKKRELGNRHLMHVLTLLNTINIQAHQSMQTVVNREAGKPW